MKLDDYFLSIQKEIDINRKKLEFWLPETSFFHKGIIEGLILAQEIILKISGKHRKQLTIKDNNN